MAKIFQNLSTPVASKVIKDIKASRPRVIAVSARTQLQQENVFAVFLFPVFIAVRQRNEPMSAAIPNGRQQNSATIEWQKYGLTSFFFLSPLACMTITCGAAAFG